jgi:hypothetical protein
MNDRKPVYCKCESPYEGARPFSSPRYCERCHRIISADRAADIDAGMNELARQLNHKLASQPIESPAPQPEPPQLGCVQGGCGYVAVNASDLVAHYRDAHEVFAVVVEVGETIARSHWLPYVETQWTPEEIKSFGEQAAAQPASLSDEEIARKHFPTVEDGIKTYNQVEARLLCLAAIREATAARDAEWKSWGVVEVAVRNPQVAEYCKHWEDRCAKAEGELAAVDDRLARRPAIADAPNRLSAIERACSTAGKADSAVSSLEDVARTLRDHEWDDLDCCRARNCLGHKEGLPHAPDCWYAALLSRIAPAAGKVTP